MDYAKVNKALAKEFGTGQVELKKYRGKQWGFTLWFLSDNPPPQTIEKAKRIVDKFEPAIWHDDKMFRS